MAIRTSRADHAPAAAADSALTAGRPSSYLTVMNALGVVPCVKHVPRNDVTRSPVPLATHGGLAGPSALVRDVRRVVSVWPGRCFVASK